MLFFAFSDNSVFLEGEEEVWLLIASHTSSVRVSVGVVAKCQPHLFRTCVYIRSTYFRCAAILPQNGHWLPSASFAKG
jgi:hypothetical protein